MSNNPYQPPFVREDWQWNARCRGLPSHVFFPPPMTGKHESAERRRIIRLAVAVCADCPVAVQCGLDAEKHREKEGVRAGVTGEQRRKNWKAQKVTA